MGISLQIHIERGGKSQPLNEVRDDMVQKSIESLEPLVREVDIVARWNQGNPAILLPNTPIEQAEETAQRIRRQLRAEFTGDDGGIEVQTRCTRLDNLDGEANRPALSR